MHLRTLATLVTCAAVSLGVRAALAQEPAPEIKLENSRFEPSEVVVPANTPFKLQVTNADKTVIEFESFELHRERIVQPGETITVYLPALAPGSYKVFDDFHSGTPEAAIVAK